jgi:hypothetical protein
MNLTAKDQADLKQDQLDWIKYRISQCLGDSPGFGEPAPKPAFCIAEQYELRTAALEIYGIQAARGPSQAVNPTGTFTLFRTCLACDNSFGFSVLPDGAINFSVETTNGRNLGSTSGQFRIVNNAAVYTGTDPECKLTFQFTHATVKVGQQGDCGFGGGVDAAGFYLKTSNVVPMPTAE